MEEIKNPEKFWKEFAEANLLKREEMIKIVIDNLDNFNDIEDEKSRKSGMTVLLLSYFDDLLQHMWAE